MASPAWAIVTARLGLAVEPLTSGAHGETGDADLRIGRRAHILPALEIEGDVVKFVRLGAFYDIGPTRHGVTRGQTIYFFDLSGYCNEVFAGGYALSQQGGRWLR